MRQGTRDDISTPSPRDGCGVIGEDDLETGGWGLTMAKELRKRDDLVLKGAGLGRDREQNSDRF